MYDDTITVFNRTGTSKEGYTWLQEALLAVAKATTSADSAVESANAATANANKATEKAEAIYELLKDVDIGDLTLKVAALGEDVGVLKETAITLDAPITFDRGEGE